MQLHTCAEERVGRQGPQTSCLTSSIRSSPNCLPGTARLANASPGFAAVSCCANPEWFGDRALQFDEMPPDKQCRERFNLLARTLQELCVWCITCLQERAAPLTLFPKYGGNTPSADAVLVPYSLLPRTAGPATGARLSPPPGPERMKGVTCTKPSCSLAPCTSHWRVGRGGMRKVKSANNFCLSSSVTCHNHSLPC